MKPLLPILLLSASAFAQTAAPSVPELPADLKTEFALAAGDQQSAELSLRLATAALNDVMARANAACGTGYIARRISQTDVGCVQGQTTPARPTPKAAAKPATAPAK
jgi:hypothetical protein